MRHLRVALNGIIAAIDSSDVATKYIQTRLNPANTFASSEPAYLFERNTDFITGLRDPALPDFTKLNKVDQKQYIKELATLPQP